MDDLVGDIIAGQMGDFHLGLLYLRQLGPASLPNSIYMLFMNKTERRMRSSRFVYAVNGTVRVSRDVHRVVHHQNAVTYDHGWYDE